MLKSFSTDTIVKLLVEEWEAMAVSLDINSVSGTPIDSDIRFIATRRASVDVH